MNEKRIRTARCNEARDAVQHDAVRRCARGNAAAAELDVACCVLPSDRDDAIARRSSAARRAFHSSRSGATARQAAARTPTATKGSGRAARPSSRATTAAGATPRPRPPRASGTMIESQPCSAISLQADRSKPGAMPRNRRGRSGSDRANAAADPESISRISSLTWHARANNQPSICIDIVDRMRCRVPRARALQEPPAPRRDGRPAPMQRLMSTKPRITRTGIPISRNRLEIAAGALIVKCRPAAASTAWPSSLERRDIFAGHPIALTDREKRRRARIVRFVMRLAEAWDQLLVGAVARDDCSRRSLSTLGVLDDLDQQRRDLLHRADELISNARASPRRPPPGGIRARPCRSVAPQSTLGVSPCSASVTIAASTMARCAVARLDAP